MKLQIRQIIFEKLSIRTINKLRRLKWKILRPFINDLRQIRKFYKSELDIPVIQGLIPALFNFDSSPQYFIDIGSNIGAYAYYIANSIDKYGGICVGFEPRTDVWRRLVRNVSATNFIGERMALSNHSGEANLFIPTSHGLSSLVKMPEFEGVQSEKVQTSTLDEYLVGHNIAPILFIKIDVEGHEFEVVEGSINTINKYMPVILCESENRHLIVQNKSTEEFINKIERLDYKTFVISKKTLRLLPVEMVKIPQERDGEQEYFFNFWFIAKKSVEWIVPSIEKILFELK